MGKATNLKFGRYIQRVHTTKSRLKIWEKLERGHIQGLPKFFEYPLLSQERIKLRTSNFVLLTNFGKSSRGRLRGLSKLLGHPYIGRIARSSWDSKAFLFEMTYQKVVEKSQKVSSLMNAYRNFGSQNSRSRMLWVLIGIFYTQFSVA